jgi:hypothetical protein
MSVQPVFSATVLLLLRCAAGIQEHRFAGYFTVLSLSVAPRRSDKGLGLLRSHFLSKLEAPEGHFLHRLEGKKPETTVSGICSLKRLITSGEVLFCLGRGTLNALRMAVVK